MAIKFSTIELILMLQKQKSISKAAEALYISEPALSKQIKRTETELGYRLVETSPSGCSLTPAGKVLADKGKTILDLRDNLLNEMKKVGMVEEKEDLRFGLANCYSEALLPSIMPSYVQNNPDQSFHFIINKTDVLEQMCADGQIDLVFTQLEYCSSKLKCVPIMTEETIVYLPKSFEEKEELKEYINSGYIPLSALADYPEVQLSGHKRFQLLTDKLFQEAGFQSHSTLRMDGWSLVRPLLESGQCYAIMPDIYSTSNQSVIRLHIRSEIPTTRTLSIAYNANKPLTDIQQNFIDLVQKALTKR